jgi:hypothetical protein
MKGVIITLLFSSAIFNYNCPGAKAENGNQKYKPEDSAQYYYNVLKKEFTSYSFHVNLSRSCLSASVLKSIDSMMKEGGKNIAGKHGNPETLSKAIYNLDQLVEKLKKYTYDKGYNAGMPLPLEQFNEFNSKLCPLWPFC